MLSLVIFGARVSMIVGFAGAAVAILIGGAVGILSGYFGGKTDIVLMRITDYFLVIPDVPLMIVAAAVFGRNLANIVIIIGVIYWTSHRAADPRAGDHRAASGSTSNARARWARAADASSGPTSCPR